MIKVLPSHIANLIAAGEVVDRPVSVVKELVENSIDSGATDITVEIKDGGITYIRVSDNGCGIPRAEVPTAFLRHATSKITNADQLNAIETLGFRGEALAAIAAVLLLAGAAMMCLRRADTANRTAASRHAWLRIVQFTAATAVVMLPLWIMGRAVLARELVPALQSPLLVPHVGAYMVAYAFLLFAAFGIGTRFAPFGYFMMTLALVLGAVWGKICWGDWWQYDPKEMWSLATWLVFGAYFHFRHRPTAAKWLLRAGAALIIITLTWVNFSKLFTGLHSYA